MYIDKIWADCTTQITLTYLSTYLANLPNRPKYLYELSLGVPCPGVTWIKHKSIKSCKMQPVGQYKVKTKMFLAVLSDKPQCCGEGNIFETKIWFLIIYRHLFTIKQKQLALKKTIINPPKILPIFFHFGIKQLFSADPTM